MVALFAPSWTNIPPSLPFSRSHRASLWLCLNPSSGHWFHSSPHLGEWILVITWSLIQTPRLPLYSNSKSLRSWTSYEFENRLLAPARPLLTSLPNSLKLNRQLATFPASHALVVHPATNSQSQEQCWVFFRPRTQDHAPPLRPRTSFNRWVQ